MEPAMPIKMLIAGVKHAGNGGHNGQNNIGNAVKLEEIGW